ncbi:MAG: DEAD/DEAH box helicase [Acidobacteria bacterium]|nr:DEAD/DEAH box helicase [Acidobacteriota bacterium]NIM60681.1 DEAD/DEAH box helicase [Acidobacteriota bacterium]NIO58641.1 DEAD/DEAH box helicase [Acidobacteriota bacterium]NIQ29697.1 DEAD/DEAH box helicase [Acidobacteriota bacterium]NIQ84414.1 DEAD/DEAH box helicase [Acidobacteriota bacterium]
MREPLPIDERIEIIRGAVEGVGCAVVIAPPGAGKTTRVPPALLDAGPLMLLQPRRVAARALTRRIAAERGWNVGAEVGWQVRQERRFEKNTRLLVATEGILTARMIEDPLLSGFRTVVLDEFHERSLHSDLALALLRQARDARPELRVVVMSATLDADPVARFLGNCPIIEIEARSHPLTIAYAPGVAPADAVRSGLEDSAGDLLVFLPGAWEIEQTARQLAGIATRADVLPLHGSLTPEAQERALAPGGRRKVILATNIAETSLTVNGVSTVIDSGLHKTPRLDAGLGFDRLETERISLDSADQRAGRAGRSGPGKALRLWDERDELRPNREPEIHRVDLAAPLLDVLAWGEDPLTFGWFDPPAPERIRAALDFLERLGAASNGKPTLLGRAMRRLPLHPRLARVVLGARGSAESAAACAALSEGWLPDHSETTDCDLLPIADRVADAPRRVRRAAEEIRRRARRAAGDLDLPERERDSIRAAVFAGYPDRLARRRAGGGSMLQLASGTGAELAKGSGVRDAELLVAIELRAARRGSKRAALVRVASKVDPAWVEPTARETVHELDAKTGKVRAFQRTLYERLELGRQQVDADAARAAALLCEAMLERGLGEGVEPALARIAFAGIDFDVGSRLLAACHGASGWFEFDPLAALDGNERRRLERQAPESISVPSGRQARLVYAGPGDVSVSVKLQELFGLAETPRVGQPPVPVTLHLLAPNGRPVQTTRDLRSFWENTYAEVRKQLRGRYPKHPWPEDPWTAEPTARTERRKQ